MKMPSRSPVQKFSICRHPFVVIMPAPLDKWIRDCPNESKPVCVSLAKFKFIEVIFKRK